MKKTFDLSNISKCRSVLFGVATILIVFFHSFYLSFSFLNVPFLVKTFTWMKNMSNIGVDIFLFLSGLGLYYSLEKDSSIKRFYIRRFKRILPAVLIVSIIYSALISHSHGIAGYFGDCFLYSFWLYGSRSFWFFSLLVVLYLIFPFIYKLCKTGPYFCVWLFIFSIVLNLLLLFLVPDYYNKVEIAVARIPVFILGAISAKYIIEGYKIPYIGTVIISILIIGASIAAKIIFKDYISDHAYIERFIYCIPACCWIILLSMFFSRFRLKAGKTFLIWIGLYSMEIYLLYEKVIKYTKDTFFKDPYYICYYLSAFVLTLVLAIILSLVAGQISKGLTFKKEKPKTDINNKA